MVDFRSISSLSSFMKQTEMQSKWKLKKDRNDYKADGSTSLDSILKGSSAGSQKGGITVQHMDEQSRLEAMLPDPPDPEEQKLREITTKYQNGEKLTEDEKEFIRKKNPELYNEIRNSDAEAENYEREIKNAKTKDEVNRIKNAHALRAYATVQSVENNPNISEGYKLAVALREMRNSNIRQKIEAEFVKSGEYEKLPTEAEEAIVREEERQAREEEVQEKKEETASKEDATKEKAEEIVAKEDATREKAEELADKIEEATEKTNPTTNEAKEKPKKTLETVDSATKRTEELDAEEKVKKAARKAIDILDSDITNTKLTIVGSGDSSISKKVTDDHTIRHEDLQEKIEKNKTRKKFMAGKEDEASKPKISFKV